MAIHQSMTGKICVVTGATSGIGEVTARTLAQMGATVIAVGRDPQRGAATLNQIKKAVPNAQVEFMLADLSAQAQIRQLAQEFKRKYARLDVLVNNAGALFTRQQESVDCIEMTFALNHLGYFLLTNLLLDALKISAPSRIINISSLGHRRVKMDFDELEHRPRYNGLLVYRQSKLANVLFTYELTRRLAGTGVTVNAVNPGFVASNFGFDNIRGLRTHPKVAKVMRQLYELFVASPEEGARTSIYLASSRDVEGVTAKYFEKQKAVPSSPESYDEATAARLWQLSEATTRL